MYSSLSSSCCRHSASACDDSGQSGGERKSRDSGCSSPLHPSQRPSYKRRLAAGGSALSLDASNCESVNNESLDLDEREIYKHFANRCDSSCDSSGPS